MSSLVLNGEVVEKAEASVPVDDRGFILGDGLFETMRAYNGVVFRVTDHLERLANSCRFFNIHPPWDNSELCAMIDSLLEKNGLLSARVRVTLTRGPHSGSMGLPREENPTLLITAEELPEDMDKMTSDGISLSTANVRFHSDIEITRHKTLNRMPNLLARSQAEEAGADEALILDARGNVATCSTGNIFFVQYEQLFTPPLTAPILPGVTRKAVLGLAEGEGIPIREDFFSPIVFAGADEAFLTNSVRELEPVVEVNNQQVGSGRPGPVFKRLLELYRKEAREAGEV